MEINLFTRRTSTDSHAALRYSSMPTPKIFQLFLRVAVYTREGERSRPDVLFNQAIGCRCEDGISSTPKM
jgi:hypothetical protein